MSKRILAIPTPGLSNGAIPIFALPSGDYTVGITTGIEPLYARRGGCGDNFTSGVTLANPAEVEFEFDIQYGNPLRRIAGCAFSVYNIPSNPTANIVDFGVTGSISLFEIFRFDGDPTGSTLGADGRLDFLFITSYDNTVLSEGFNSFSGQWTLNYYFDGITSSIETLIIDVFYRVFVPYTRNNKQDPYKNTKISPHSYTDEYIILNNRVDTESTKGRPNLPGNNKGE